MQILRVGPDLLTSIERGNQGRSWLSLSLGLGKLNNAAATAGQINSMWNGVCQLSIVEEALLPVAITTA